MPKYTLPSKRASVEYAHELGEIDFKYPNNKTDIIHCLREALIEHAKTQQALKEYIKYTK